MALYLGLNQPIQNHIFPSFLDSRSYEIPNTTAQGGRFDVIKMERDFFVRELDTEGGYQSFMLDSLGSREFIALKVPRTTLREENVWAATNGEYQILCHPPLVENKNIVKLVGLTWIKRRSRGGREAIIPAIFLEWAAFGTLTAFQESGKGSTYKEQLQIALDISEGIHALHLSGIVHCDIKSENVLIFPHGDNGFVAKVTDFDSCIFMSQVEGGTQLRDATKVYSVPECSRIISLDDLPKVDIYSFGLLVWQVLLDGRNFVEILTDLVEEPVSVEDIKSRDMLKHLAWKSIGDHHGRPYDAERVDGPTPATESDSKPYPNFTEQKSGEIKSESTGSDSSSSGTRNAVQRFDTRSVQYLCLKALNLNPVERLSTMAHASKAIRLAMLAEVRQRLLTPESLLTEDEPSGHSPPRTF